MREIYVKLMSSRFARQLVVAMLGMLLASPGLARAQARAGALFNQVFNVGGVGTQFNDIGIGSAGCGNGGGGNLSTLLNAAVGGSGFDGGPTPRPVNQRRELWRFCDSMTETVFGGDLGSWTTTTIAPNQEQTQNTGLAPAQLFSQSDIAKSLGRAQIQSIGMRIAQLRVAMRGGAEAPGLAIARQAERPQSPVDLSFARALLGLSFADEEQRRIEATSRMALELQRVALDSGENAFGTTGLGLFFQGRYHRIDADLSLDQSGGTTNGGGFNLGTDYRLSDASVIGGAFAYSHFATDFDLGAGDSKTNDYAFMAFGSHFVTDELYVDAILRGSYMSFEQTKIVPAFDGGSTFLPRISDPDGWTLAGDVGIGLDKSFDQLLVNPYLRLRVSHARIADFTESGGDGTLNLRVNQQRVTSIPLTIGTSLSYAISTDAGVIAPYVRGQYLHEFGDQAASVSGFLLVLPNAGFKLSPNATDRNYGQVGGGATLTLPRGLSGFVDYDALVGFTDLVTHTLTLGLRMDL